MNNSQTIPLLSLVLTCMTSPLATAQLGPASTLATGSQPDSAAAADLNGDGLVDLAITADAPDRVSLHFGTGGGAFGAEVPVFVGAGTGPAAIAIADADGDSDLDLILTLHNVNGLQVLMNSGTGIFTPQATVAVGLDPRHIAVADIDGDNDVDVVTSNRDSNNVTVLLNNGLGAYSVSSTIAVGVDPRAVVLARLDGDRFPDLAVSGHDDARVDVLLNNGSGGFVPSTSFFTGTVRPDGLTAADLDGDLDNEIIVATSDDDLGLNFFSIWSNTGAGFTGPLNVPAGGSNGSGVVAADLDLDGDRDLAMGNADSGNISVALNMGSGVFAAATQHAAGATPEFLLTAGVDENASPDLVAVNRDSNSASVFLSSTAGIGTTFCIGQVACPCNNNGGSSLSGCMNSTGGGASLSASGSTSVGSDDLVLRATGFPPNNTGLFFMGEGTFSPVDVGDGLGCTGGILRFQPSMVDGTGALTLNGPVGNSMPGQIAAGASRSFQSWTRDVLCGPPPAPCPTPCGQQSNLSSGLTILFTP